MTQSRKRSTQQRGDASDDDKASKRSKIADHGKTLTSKRSEHAGSVQVIQPAHSSSGAYQTLLTSFLDRRRNAVLSRISGKVVPEEDLVCLEEPVATLRRTLEATITRGEGNTVLLVGPRGSGKSAILKTSLGALSLTERPFHHVYISAKTCTTDRAAMRELARQLIEVGALAVDEETRHRLSLDDNEEEEGEGVDEASDEDTGGSETMRAAKAQDALEEDEEAKAALGAAVLSSLSNTTSSILSMLASSASNARPLIITLDSFDLLTARPRQALLYCLFDAVQSGTYRPGLTIVGMTRQPDTTDLLEKRVKSRFSHRTIHCYPPGTSDDWLLLVKKTLNARQVDEVSHLSKDEQELWDAWQKGVDALLVDERFRKMLTRIIDLSRDVQHLFQVLYQPIASLTTEKPQIYLPAFLDAERSLRRDWVRSVLLHELPTMSFLLLVAAKHLQTRDRDVFNFEIAFDEVAQFGRRSRRNREGAGTGGLGLKEMDTAATASPRSQRAFGAGDSTSDASDWQDRHRAMRAFEQLLSLELFLPDAFLSTLSFGPSNGGGRRRNNGNGKAQPAKSVIVGSTSGTAAMGTAVAARTAVRKEYLRVRSVLDPATIIEVARARGKKGSLQTDIVQWAVRAG